MFTTRLPSILLASLLALGAFFVNAPEAHANARQLGAAAQRQHARAAQSTGVASREWARFGQLSQQFDVAMRSSNAAYRAQAKRIAVNWLRQMQSLIRTAANDHRAAVNALNAYLRYVGRNPQAEALRNTLANTERGLRNHINELSNIIVRVNRMR